MFKYSCLHFPPPIPPTPAIPTSHPWSHPHLVLSMCPLYLFLKTLPPFPTIIPSHLPSGYCQFVLNFNVSGYILFACLFCWLAKCWKQPKCPSVNKWIKKLVHLHNEILHSRKKEGAPTLCDGMDGRVELYAKWNKPGSERQIPNDLTYKWNQLTRYNFINIIWYTWK